jgi:hypothetical protein
MVGLMDDRPVGPSVITEYERIAFHEAGHAVVAVAEGLGLRHATLVPRARRADEHAAQPRRMAAPRGARAVLSRGFCGERREVSENTHQGCR